MTTTYTFKNGSVVTGTWEEIEAIAKILGEEVEKAPPGYYRSTSKGLVPLKEMHDLHLIRSLTKIAREYYINLGSQELSLEEYGNKFIELVKEPQLEELYGELMRRIGMEKMVEV